MWYVYAHNGASSPLVEAPGVCSTVGRFFVSRDSIGRDGERASSPGLKPQGREGEAPWKGAGAVDGRSYGEGPCLARRGPFGRLKPVGTRQG